MSKQKRKLVITTTTRSTTTTTGTMRSTNPYHHPNHDEITKFYQKQQRCMLKTTIYSTKNNLITNK